MLGTDNDEVFSPGEASALAALRRQFGEPDHIVDKAIYYNCPRHDDDKAASFNYNVATHSFECFCDAADLLSGRSLNQLKRQLKIKAKTPKAPSKKSKPKLIDNAHTTLSQLHDGQNQLISSAWSHDVLELTLAGVVNAQRSEDLPVWLCVVGAPSSSKTEITTSVRNCTSVHMLDELTENAFSSGLIDQQGNPRGVDLLPMIDGKLLNIKDLSSLFSKRAEIVQNVVGQMTNIYDGSYTKHTGSRGSVAYDSRFAFLGCITPAALARHPEYMNRLGARILFYHLPQSTPEELTRGLAMSNDNDRQTKLREFVARVSVYGEQLLQCANELVRASEAILDELDSLAKFLARCRSLGSWTENRKTYEVLQAEEPYRVKGQLLALARALAIVHRHKFGIDDMSKPGGIDPRLEITAHDMELVRRVVLATVPRRYAAVLKSFYEPDKSPPNSILTVSHCVQLGLSDQGAMNLLDELETLEVLQCTQKKPKGWQPVPEFNGVLSRTVEAWGATGHIADCWGL
jgi:hypothetical protein